MLYRTKHNDAQNKHPNQCQGENLKENMDSESPAKGGGPGQ